jgi:hypothetical protein
VSPHDDETDRERRRENEPDWAPEPRPKHCSDNERDGGNTGARAVEPRFHHIIAQQFEQDEKADR